MFIRACLIASISLGLAACGGRASKPGPPPPANILPTAAADSARLRPGTSVELDLLANDQDGDGDALSIEVQGAHASATFQIVGNRLRVTPAAGFGGTLTFAYRARDSRGGYSPPANVTVEVGAIARAMLALSPAGAGPARVIVAGSSPDERVDLVTMGSCNQSGWASIAADGRRILARRCVSPTRSDIILAAPRAPALGAPTVVYGNAALAPGQVNLNNFAELVVAERVSNPDDPVQGSTYDLVRIDVAQRAVVQRMALAGIDQVSLVRFGGGPRRALVTGRETNGDFGHFVADLDAGTVRRVTPAADIDIEYSTVSPDGRFLVSNWPIPDHVRGYDTQAPVPAQAQVLWTVPGAGVMSYVTNTQFLPAPATLLVEVMDLVTRDVVVWVVPLATPGDARELVRFRSSTAHLRMQVRDDIACYASDAGGGRSHVNRVRVSTGEILGPLTPAGGVILDSVVFFTGSSLLFTMTEDSQGTGLATPRRAARIRVDAPGVVQLIAPTLSPEPYSLTIDRDETTVGFVAANAAGQAAAWLVDINLPATAVPLAGALQPAEDAAYLLVLGAPDPSN
jgi:hypothetical protein